MLDSLYSGMSGSRAAVGIGNVLSLSIHYAKNLGHDFGGPSKYDREKRKVGQRNRISYI